MQTTGRPPTQLEQGMTRAEPSVVASPGAGYPTMAVDAATRPESSAAAVGEGMERIELSHRWSDEGGRAEVGPEDAVAGRGRRSKFPLINSIDRKSPREILCSTPKDLLFGWRSYVAEYFGTLILVLGGTGSAIASLSFLGAMSAISVVSISLGFAFAVAAGVYFAALTSGGHLNPAITIAFMVTANIPLTTGIIYIISQCLGAITASAILLGAIPREVGRKVLYGANTLTMDRPIGDTGTTWSMPIGGAVLLEIATTFLLVSVVFAVARLRVDPKQFGKLGPLAIGLAVGVCHLIAIPFDGCSINPARSLGPAVISSSLGPAAVQQVWANHWVFWVGPIAGGIIAGLIYQCLLISWEDMAMARDQRNKVERLLRELRV